MQIGKSNMSWKFIFSLLVERYVDKLLTYDRVALDCCVRLVLTLGE